MVTFRTSKMQFYLIVVKVWKGSTWTHAHGHCAIVVVELIFQHTLSHFDVVVVIIVVVVVVVVAATPKMNFYKYVTFFLNLTCCYCWHLKRSKSGEQ